MTKYPALIFPKVTLICSAILFCLTTAFAINVVAEPQIDQAAVNRVTHQLEVRYKYSANAARSIIRRARFNPQVIRDFQDAAHNRNWSYYSNKINNPEFTKNALSYYRRFRKILTWQERHHYVPPNVVVAYLALASNFGKNMGHYREIDVLKTLAFYYPPTKRFYQKQLESYLLYTRQRHRNPFRIYGSYSGKMGYPQLLPTDVLYYSRNFQMYKLPNIFTNRSDSIFTLGNYLMQNFWRKGQPIATPARVTGTQYEQLLKNKKRWYYLEQLENYGVTPVGFTDTNEKAKLFVMPGETKPKYYLVFHNFAVLEHNNGPYFAMAVYQFSQKLYHLRQEQIRKHELKAQQR